MSNQTTPGSLKEYDEIEVKRRIILYNQTVDRIRELFYMAEKLGDPNPQTETFYLGYLDGDSPYNSLMDTLDTLREKMLNLEGQVQALKVIHKRSYYEKYLWDHFGIVWYKDKELLSEIIGESTEEICNILKDRINREIAIRTIQ